ncbi:hypothetical protein IWX89_003148 [Cryobacterium sp. MP_M3]|nr:hypothetical protein [Cryobacterium sp. MP_M3]
MVFTPEGAPILDAPCPRGWIYVAGHFHDYIYGPAHIAQVILHRVNPYTTTAPTASQNQPFGLACTREGQEGDHREHDDQNNVALHREKPEEIERVDRCASGGVEEGGPYCRRDEQVTATRSEGARSFMFRRGSRVRILEICDLHEP